MSERPDTFSTLPYRSDQPPPSPIVPRQSIAGRALVAVVAIMTFLASLTVGAVMLVRASAADWESDVSREITIQVRPSAGRDLDAAATKAAAIARDAAGVANVKLYSREESARLLEPWLGSGLTLEELPVPRMIVVTLSSGAKPDLTGLRKTLSEQVPGSSLDDHRGWIDRMRSMANTAVAIGFAVLALVLAATTLSVSFATRGAMAANRPVIEVLHFIGARDSYIAGHFQHHFLVLGLQGGALGGGAAILLFLIASMIGGAFSGGAATDQVSALFGTFSIGFFGYVAVLLQIVLVAGVTAYTSRRTVTTTLSMIE
jgi:cell division transport system permease protein